MKLINASYAILIDSVKRAEHDAWIKDQNAKTVNDNSYTSNKNNSSFESENTNHQSQNHEKSETRTTNTTSENTYNNVGGWLLILCFGLMIPVPLSFLGRLSVFRIFFLPEYSDYPGLILPSQVCTLLTLGIACFSFIAGYYLWKRQQSAVKIAKAFFLSVFAYSILWPIILTSAHDMPAKFYHSIINDAALGIISTLLNGAIWYIYLCRSKRVKATYSPVQQPSDNSQQISENKFRGTPVFIAVIFITGVILVYHFSTQPETPKKHYEKPFTSTEYDKNWVQGLPYEKQQINDVTEKEPKEAEEHNKTDDKLFCNYSDPYMKNHKVA
jgi:hypothetical protein